MPITKKALKNIASTAWTKCYNNISETYRVHIRGDTHAIMWFLETYSQEMNDRDDNRDFCCGVEQDDDNMFVFFVVNRDPLRACYYADSEDDDEQVIVEDGEVIDEEEEDEEEEDKEEEDKEDPSSSSAEEKETTTENPSTEPKPKILKAKFRK